MHHTQTSPDHDAERRLTREISELERRIAEVEDLRTIYHDHLMRLLHYRLRRRRDALERIRHGESIPVLGQPGLEPLR
jgi:hypothetical protein